MNDDRFSQGLPDPQETEHDSYCAGCGEAIDEKSEGCVWENVQYNIRWHNRKHCKDEVMQKYLGCQEA